MNFKELQDLLEPLAELGYLTRDVPIEVSPGKTITVTLTTLDPSSQDAVAQVLAEAKQAMLDEVEALEKDGVLGEDQQLRSMQQSKIMRNLMDSIRAATLSRSIIRINGVPIPEFIETGEMQQGRNGVPISVKKPRHEMMGDILLNRLNRDVMDALANIQTDLGNESSAIVAGAIAFDAKEVDFEIRHLENRLERLRAAKESKELGNREKHAETVGTIEKAVAAQEAYEFEEDPAEAPAAPAVAKVKIPVVTTPTTPPPSVPETPRDASRLSPVVEETPDAPVYQAPVTTNDLEESERQLDALLSPEPVAVSYVPRRAVTPPHHQAASVSDTPTTVGYTQVPGPDGEVAYTTTPQVLSPYTQTPTAGGPREVDKITGGAVNPRFVKPGAMRR